MPGTKRRRGRPPARESAALRAEFGDARVIRRYGNRRLYDTQLSRCVKLEEIAGFVRAGQEVRVLSAEDGEDITRRILAQILLEDAHRDRLAMMPIDLFRKLIALKDETSLAWLEQYMLAGLATLDKHDKKMVDDVAMAMPVEALTGAAAIRASRVVSS